MSKENPFGFISLLQEDEFSWGKNIHLLKHVFLLQEYKSFLVYKDTFFQTMSDNVFLLQEDLSFQDRKSRIGMLWARTSLKTKNQTQRHNWLFIPPSSSSPIPAERDIVREWTQTKIFYFYEKN